MIRDERLKTGGNQTLTMVSLLHVMKKLDKSYMESIKEKQISLTCGFGASRVTNTMKLLEKQNGYENIL